MAIRLVIAGAAGRMGRRIIALATGDANFHVAGALEASNSPALGRDVGEVAGIGQSFQAITDTPPSEYEVLVDFSTPEGTSRWLDTCCKYGKPIVIGTTGHDEAVMNKIRDAAGQIAVLKAANMSIGVNLLLRLARQAATALDHSYDVEIIETHHRFKVDAPSGTALALKDAVRQGQADAGRDGGQVVHGRQGQVGARTSGEIGMHALRLGDTVGEHTLYFGAIGETIGLSHSAHSRDTFASGALRAAAWIAGKPCGLYDMQDVLFGGR